MVARFRLNPCGALVVLVLMGLIALYWFGGSIYYITGYAVSMRQVLAVSIQLAERGGTAVRLVHEKHVLRGRSKGLTREGGKEMLTDGDIRSHQAIIYGFAKSFPALKVISEEHETRPIDFRYIPLAKPSLPAVDAVIQSDLFVNMRDLTVWIDPLDATQEYTENLTQYVTVLVCVVHRGVPLVGIVHQPFQNKTYWAWRGYGSSPSLRAVMHPAKAGPLPDKVVVSRSHAGEVASVIKEAFGAETNVVPAGGAGYKALEVIRGRADLYAHVTAIKKWDICAPNALLSAAGGSLTDLAGRSVDYSAHLSPELKTGVLASLSGKMHRAAIHALTDPVAALKRQQKSGEAKKTAK